MTQVVVIVPNDIKLQVFAFTKLAVAKSTKTLFVQSPGPNSVNGELWLPFNAALRPDETLDARHNLFRQDLRKSSERASEKLFHFSQRFVRRILSVDDLHRNFLRVEGGGRSVRQHFDPFTPTPRATSKQFFSSRTNVRNNRAKKVMNGKYRSEIFFCDEAAT